MRVSNFNLLIVCALIVLFGAAPVAIGDWDDGNPYVMHYPQLPDPYGFGACLCTSYIADDFQCTQTGDITDLHFWYVWQDGIIGIPSWEIAIYEDCGGKPCASPVWTWTGGGNISTRVYGTSWLNWFCWNPYYDYYLGPMNYYQVT